ncbi:transcription initiation at TATA-containing promoter protein [Tilletia horrida]|nr:transcription initiation at TATA-containing promoter protein [Tilletia horrida]
MSQPTEQGASPAVASSSTPQAPVLVEDAAAASTASAAPLPAAETAAVPDADIAPVDPSASQMTPPASQPAAASSPLEHPPSQPMPLTQEPPPPTQSTTTDGTASQTQASFALPSLPPSQATQPTAASPESAPTLTQASETALSADASTSTAASTVPDAVTAPDSSAAAAAAAAGETVAHQDPAPFAAHVVEIASQPFAKVDPDAVSSTPAAATVAPTTPDLANGSHPGESPAAAAPALNGALPTPSPTIASAASAPAMPPPKTPAAATAGTPAAEGSRRGPPGPVQMTSSQIKFAQGALRSLKLRQEARWFLDAVDPVAMNIPTYYQVVKEPMDLGTIDFKLSLTSYNRTAKMNGNPSPRPSEKVRNAIARKLDPARDYYTTVGDFVRDVKLVFANCAKFNGEEHLIALQGRELEKLFEKQMVGMPAAEPEPEIKVISVAPAPKPRASSTSTPAARRTSTTDASGRPKREIIPPSRDVPWDDEPHSNSTIPSTSIAKKRRRTALTPREQAYYARVNAEDLRFAQKLMDDMYKPAHQNIAWVFYDLPDSSLDFAPAYYEMIKKPVSMRKIAMMLKAGEFTDLSEFDASWQLLFKNCFTFNPPDTDVWQMGKKLKDIYEEKMKKRPIHPPLSPDPLEDVDMAEVDTEESRLALIQAQIARLEAEAASLKSKDSKPTKTKAGPAVGGPSTKKAKTSAASAAAAAAPLLPTLNGGAPKVAAEPAAPKAPKKKAPKPKEANGAAAGGSKKKSGTGAGGASSPTRRTSSGGANGAAKKQRRESQPAKVVDTFQEISYPQKEELATKIQELPEDRLDGALSIIAEDKPPSAGDQDEIELDIDAISPRTLYKLYTYVVGPLPPIGSATAAGGANGSGHGGAGGAGAGGSADGAGAAGSSKSAKKKNAKKSKPASGAGAADGRKRGTGGLKRKNLDEEEEAQRIASLRQQLNQFNSGDASGSVSALPVDGAHDDLVHSDSSSGDESGSDSDSDFD